MKTVGLISDTHGLLRPEALEALRGSDLIVHAGDVGSIDVLQALTGVAPVVAVAGNVDRAGEVAGLPATQAVEAGGRWLYVLHDLAQLDLDPRAGGFDVVIFGHSHQPTVQHRDGVLYVNPGSAGPRRFRLPVSVARLQIADGTPQAEIITLRE